MTVSTQLTLGGAALASWLVLWFVTSKVPQAKHQSWELARTLAGVAAALILIPVLGNEIRKTRLGGDLCSACSFALMGGIVIVGVIAAIGNIGDRFGGGGPPDGGAGA